MIRPCLALPCPALCFLAPSSHVCWTFRPPACRIFSTRCVPSAQRHLLSGFLRGNDAAHTMMGAHCPRSESQPPWLGSPASCGPRCSRRAAWGGASSTPSGRSPARRGGVPGRAGGGGGHSGVSGLLSSTRGCLPAETGAACLPGSESIARWGREPRARLSWAGMMRKDEGRASLVPCAGPLSRRMQVRWAGGRAGGWVGGRFALRCAQVKSLQWRGIFSPHTAHILHILCRTLTLGMWS